MTAAGPCHAIILDHSTFCKESRAATAHGYARPDERRLSLETSAARLVGRLSRRGRGGGDPARQARVEARSGCSRRARRPAPARRRARLGDEREDDDHGDGRVDPLAHGRLAWNHLGREPRFRRRVDAARRATPTSGFSRSTSSRCRDLRRTRPRVVELGNLFRDQLDRYGELEHIAERWRAAVTRSSLPKPCSSRTPTIPSSRRSPASGEGHPLRDRRPAPRASRAPARLGLEVLRALRRPVPLRRGLRRPPRRVSV